MLKHRYRSAATYAEYVQDAQQNQELWESIRRRALVPDELVRRTASIPGRWHLLVLSEDWCGDAFNTVPLVSALADVCDNLDLRILARDRNLDLMDAHLTNGSRSIPVVILLDEAYQERGWWGPRPRELQEWVMTQGKKLPPPDRYREVRRWYARDHGLSTLEEVITLLERAAEQRDEAVA